MLASGSCWPEITELCSSHGFRCYIRNEVGAPASRAEIVIESPRTYYAGATLNPDPRATVSMA